MAEFASLDSSNLATRPQNPSPTIINNPQSSATMSSQVTNTDFPIRVNPPDHPKPPPPDLHRYWRNHKDDGYLERYWPEGEQPYWPEGAHDHSASIAPIRAVLKRELPQFADAEIDFFAKGTYNRLYSLTNPAWDKSYIFRVSLPIDPFFKTESEMATMEYVRRHTTLPVPRVVAFSSSDDNELGYEWVVMEMMPGQPLRKLWPTMPDDARVAFFAELAHHTKQLVALRFSKLGNLYFSDVADHVLPPQPPSSPTKPPHNPHLAGTVNRDLNPNDPFILGRIVSPEFFFDKRIYYPVARGPFSTTRELIDARLSLLHQRLNDLSPAEATPWYSANDRELHRHKPLVDAILTHFASLIPALFPAANGPEDVGILWHDDLSEHNLLLDPATYKLTGVVDWEAVSVMPAFEIQDARPAWLSDRDWRPTRLVQWARGVPDNGEWLVAERLRRVGEMGAAREVYHVIVGRVFEDDDGGEEMRRRVERKVGAARQLGVEGFLQRPWATGRWMVENGLIGDGLGAAVAAADGGGDGVNVHDTDGGGFIAHDTGGDGLIAQDTGGEGLIAHDTGSEGLIPVLTETVQGDTATEA